MCSENFLIKIKEASLKDRDELTKEISSLRKEMESNGHEGGDDSGDVGNHSEEKSTLCSKIERRKEKIAQIDKALRKTEHGNYGICEDCGGPISEERLKLEPTTERCRTCAHEKCAKTINV